VEPGIYLDGEMGVRIEDLVVLDAAARRLDRLTMFPREIVVVGAGTRAGRPLP
jgi:Xaa-Pro aminopeptidase